MFDLWQKLFNSTRLGKDSEEDRNRLGMLTLAKATEMTDSVSVIGHTIAKSHAASHLTPARKLLEVYDGITQVFSSVTVPKITVQNLLLLCIHVQMTFFLFVTACFYETHSWRFKYQ